MTINTIVENETKTIFVEGEINTLTAPQLAEAAADLEGIKTLIFDLDGLSYTSSAGLRIFLASNLTMVKNGGEMSIRNCNPMLMEIFTSVGYDNIFSVQAKPEDAAEDCDSEKTPE